MSIFFGTDGIRGKFNCDFTDKLAYMCGNSLARFGKKLKIVVGRDTRKSGDLIAHSFMSGAMAGGANVTDVGVCPTAGIAYIAMQGFDFGVVISASHNPAEFNGIKIFDKQGHKICEDDEKKIEKGFAKQFLCEYDCVGRYHYAPHFVRKYENYLLSLFDFNLLGKRVVVDCSNGASAKIAGKIFKKLGAEVFCLGCRPNGLNINKNCGAIHPERLQREVLRKRADFGFAYDGDSDRIVAVDEDGKVVHGDILIFIFAEYFRKHGRLYHLKVVGTKQTNMGVEKALENRGIELIRTDVGDKYISREIEKCGLLLGGEQSGHIIVKDYLPTGDGVLSSVILSYICLSEGKKLTEYENVPLYYQSNKNIEVSDKAKVCESEKVKSFVRECEEKLAGKGRIVIRPSGTEPCVRIMVESESFNLSEKVSEQIAEIVKIDETIQ